MKYGSANQYATLKNLLYASVMKYNLISIRAATENGMMIPFGWIKSEHGRVVATGTLHEKLYRIDHLD